MENTSVRPFVTVILVTRNEKNHIEASLNSLFNQTYPKECYEIVIVDGMSTDETPDIINRLAESYNKSNLEIRIFQNPKKILSAGWNIGIKEAKGNYVVRIDAHAEAASNFIEKSVETMMRVDAVCVGGKLTTKSLPGDKTVISKVLSSRFGVGGSSFRVSNTEGYADTAVYGLYKKEIFEKVGYFNESFVRNQDIEMHGRIKRAGGKFYFNPEIECIYYARNSTAKMMRQAHGNGKWNMILFKKAKASLSIRHLVPFAFVLFLLFAIVGGCFYWPIWLVGAGVLLLHLTLGLIAGIAKTKRFVEFIQMPILFMLLHISYGIGYFSGIFKRIKD